MSSPTPRRRWRGSSAGALAELSRSGSRHRGNEAHLANLFTSELAEDDEQPATEENDLPTAVVRLLTETESVHPMAIHLGCCLQLRRPYACEARIVIHVVD